MSYCPVSFEAAPPEIKSPSTRSILIAEEDASLATFLSRELQSGLCSVVLTHDGETAIRALENDRRYDLLILDLNLPRLDGMTLMQRVKPGKPNLPMMVLSARCRIEDKVMAFQSGADDFLSKPFSILELKARIEALLRRHTGFIPNTSRVGDLTLHRAEYRVNRNGRQIDLTPREFGMLEYLMRHAGRPVSRATLFEEVWKAPHDPSTNIVDVYMKYVRDKVDRPGERKLTHTIRGVGYEVSDGRGEQA